MTTELSLKIGALLILVVLNMAVRDYFGVNPTAWMVGNIMGVAILAIIRFKL